jgi:hypothetical protein
MCIYELYYFIINRQRERYQQPRCLLVLDPNENPEIIYYKYNDLNII